MIQRLASVCLLAAVSLAPPADAQGATRLDFDAMGRDFLAANGVPGVQTFPEFVDSKAFVRVELGAYDVRMPVLALSDKKYAERFEDAAVTLVEVQRVWQRWRGDSNDEVEKDWTTLAKWVKSWTARKLSKCDGGAESLYVQLSAKAKVTEAAARLAEVAAYPESTVKLIGDRCITVLAPNRELFVKINATAGLLDEDKRWALWTDKMPAMGAAWFEWIQIIALENIGEVDWNHPFTGISLNEAEKTGLAQHVADRAGIVLLRKEFCVHGTHFFEETLATNLIISTVGKNRVESQDWEMKYSQKGGSTEPYTRFIPGGNPGGGKLPARKAKAGPKMTTFVVSAIGHYRENSGLDYFVDPVRAGQREGAKIAAKQKKVPFYRDKRPHFHLYSLDANTSTIVTAPFLGIPAEGKALPGHEYLDDYEDLFRAYRSCFVNWLANLGGGADEAESNELFAKLIEAHGEREIGTPLDDIILKVYGIPLSHADDSVENLEWRYLDWLKAG